MKKNYLVVLAFGIFFLFLIQMAGTLVESIYILDLMNTSLDEKALGVLFFFSPVFLIFFRKKIPGFFIWILVGFLFTARGLTPYLNTLGRMLSSGVATGTALMLLPSLLISKTKADNTPSTSHRITAGLALAIGFSVLLRTVNYGLDYSLFPEGGWVGWVLGIVLVYSFIFIDWNTTAEKINKPSSVTLSMIGIFLVIGLVWFAFSAPTVIARWTESDYKLIVIAVSLLALIFAIIPLVKPRWIEEIPQSWLLIWNLVFTISLLMTILAHRISFPQTPDSPAVIVGTPTTWQQVPLVILLISFPVIFLDLHIFIRRVRQNNPRPLDLIPGMLLGSLALVLLVFMHIFTNVWGYVEPISPWFRNKFWLPYLFMAGLIVLLIGRKGLKTSHQEIDIEFPRVWKLFLSAIFLVSAGSALLTTQVQTFETRNNTFVVMTYNIQQANDDFGERSYKEQLELIRQVGPDILAIQESDSTRISLNNNDYVRYYAGRLGYYSYFGPTTVTGSYGTAILSRFPLENTQSIFTFSDQDEVGSAEAEIVVDGKRFIIYNVHPDGSDEAMIAFADTLLNKFSGKPNLIALGDYNLRDYEEAYQMIASEFTNVWEYVYPSKIGSDGTDMSGENRIDHIFISPSLDVQNPIYVLPPASATDHPVHWAEISW